MYDVVIVGAGPVGCILAEKFSKIGLKIFVVDKRNHIAGNCYDTYSENKVLFHRYGPHYFRTNKKEILNYLKEFSDFHKAEYIVKSYVKNDFYDFPINLNTINKFFKKKFDSSEAKRFLKKLAIKNYHKNFESFLLEKVGNEIYENFYKNYTWKQWGINPQNLPVRTAKRIPIRFDTKNTYVNEKFQVMPSNGFTDLFNNMLNSKNISLDLEKDYFKIKDKINPKLFTIYTGPIDRFFNFKYGKLGWRSLKFEFNEYNTNFKQKYLQVNYPNNYKFTRKVEVKHITNQRSDYTVISKEYPQSHGDPYYPVNSLDDKIMYKKYLKLTKKYKNIFFIGRLAEYTYINTDQAIERAMNFYDSIKFKL